jgi:hypothetical protein
MKQDNSGPAFPLPADTAMLAAITPSTGALGMTMRQYYAGQALIGLLARGDIEPASAVIETAWRMADDMLLGGDK